MQNRTRHMGWVLFLWFCFISAIGIAAYLSFQNGQEAKEYSQRIMQYLAGRSYPDRVFTEQEMMEFTYKGRQLGRIALFFLIGIWGTVTIHVTFWRWHGLLRTMVTLLILFAAAYLTERLKIYIPTRHYSYEEMTFSIAAALMGFLLVSTVILSYHILKNLFRIIGIAVSGGF